MNKTETNLQQAITGEARARLKYTAFAMQGCRKDIPKLRSYSWKRPAPKRFTESAICGSQEVLLQRWDTWTSRPMVRTTRLRRCIRASFVRLKKRDALTRLPASV